MAPTPQHVAIKRNANHWDELSVQSRAEWSYNSPCCSHLDANRQSSYLGMRGIRMISLPKLLISFHLRNIENRSSADMLCSQWRKRTTGISTSTRYPGHMNRKWHCRWMKLTYMKIKRGWSILCLQSTELEYEIYVLYFCMKCNRVHTAAN